MFWYLPRYDHTYGKERGSTCLHMYVHTGWTGRLYYSQQQQWHACVSMVYSCMMAEEQQQQAALQIYHHNQNHETLVWNVMMGEVGWELQVILNWKLQHAAGRGEINVLGLNEQYVQEQARVRQT